MLKAHRISLILLAVNIIKIAKFHPKQITFTGHWTVLNLRVGKAPSDKIKLLLRRFSWLSPKIRVNWIIRGIETEGWGSGSTAPSLFAQNKVPWKIISICSYSKSLENDIVATLDNQNSELFPEPSALKGALIPLIMISRVVVLGGSALFWTSLELFGDALPL